MNEKKMKEISSQLKKASNMHAGQARKIDSMLKMRSSALPGMAKYMKTPLEKKKGKDGKACWKGYKLQGTKMKGGKRVDNCVKM